MTRNVVIDATALQPFTGGVLRGRDQVKAGFRQAGAGAKTVHRITNFLLLEEEKGNQAKTSSYVDHWHYVKGALGDKTKTWRIQYRSGNTWVKQGGEWKLQYNQLYDLAYGAERPFYRYRCDVEVWRLA
ncbi:hypothetical protein MBLNU13_g10460t1 [Cladosporium sp. NU13]